MNPPVQGDRVDRPGDQDSRRRPPEGGLEAPQPHPVLLPRRHRLLHPRPLLRVEAAADLVAPIHGAEEAAGEDQDGLNLKTVVRIPKFVSKINCSAINMQYT